MFLIKNSCFQVYKWNICPFLHEKISEKANIVMNWSNTNYKTKVIKTQLVLIWNLTSLLRTPASVTNTTTLKFIKQDQACQPNELSIVVITIVYDFNYSYLNTNIITCYSNKKWPFITCAYLETRS